MFLYAFHSWFGYNIQYHFRVILTVNGSNFLYYTACNCLLHTCCVFALREVFSLNFHNKVTAAWWMKSLFFRVHPLCLSVCGLLPTSFSFPPHPVSRLAHWLWLWQLATLTDFCHGPVSVGSLFQLSVFIMQGTNQVLLGNIPQKKLSISDRQHQKFILSLFEVLSFWFNLTFWVLTFAEVFSFSLDSSQTTLCFIKSFLQIKMCWIRQLTRTLRKKTQISNKF